MLLLIMLLHKVGWDPSQIASGLAGPFRFVEGIVESHEPGLDVQMAALGVTVVIKLTHNLCILRSSYLKLWNVKV